jgi:hypothetical protein
VLRNEKWAISPGDLTLVSSMKSRVATSRCRLSYLPRNKHSLLPIMSTIRYSSYGG